MAKEKQNLIPENLDGFWDLHKSIGNNFRYRFPEQRGELLQRINMRVEFEFRNPPVVDLGVDYWTGLFGVLNSFKKRQVAGWPLGEPTSGETSVKAIGIVTRKEWQKDCYVFVVAKNPGCEPFAVWISDSPEVRVTNGSQKSSSSNDSVRLNQLQLSTLGKSIGGIVENKVWPEYGVLRITRDYFDGNNLDAINVLTNSAMLKKIHE